MENINIKDQLIEAGEMTAEQIEALRAFNRSVSADELSKVRNIAAVIAEEYTGPTASETDSSYYVIPLGAVVFYGSVMYLLGRKSTEEREEKENAAKGIKLTLDGLNDALQYVEAYYRFKEINIVELLFTLSRLSSYDRWKFAKYVEELVSEAERRENE